MKIFKNFNFFFQCVSKYWTEVQYGISSVL